MKSILPVLAGFSILLSLFTIQYKFRLVDNFSNIISTRDSVESVRAQFIKKELNEQLIEIGEEIDDEEADNFLIFEEYVLSRIDSLPKEESKEILINLSEITTKIYEYKGYEY